MALNKMAISIAHNRQRGGTASEIQAEQRSFPTALAQSLPFAIQKLTSLPNKKLATEGHLALPKPFTDDHTTSSFFSIRRARRCAR